MVISSLGHYGLLSCQYSHAKLIHTEPRAIHLLAVMPI